MSITHAFPCPIADDAAAAAAGEVLPSHWNDGHAIDSITITGGTVTASTPLIDATQTWNNAAVTFTGLKLNVTNTASASGSLLADWQVGGVSKFQVTKDGRIGAARGYAAGLPQFYDSTIGSDSGFQILNEYGCSIVHGGAQIYKFDVSNQTGFRIDSTYPISWISVGAAGGTFNAQLRSDGAQILAQRNFGSYTSGQTFRVYGTYTDSSNYVRASLASSSTAVTLAAETAGTGADNVPVNLTPAGTEGVVIGNFAQLTEMTAPAAGAANTARLFCEDNGSGKTRLMVQFASGAAVQLAIEP